MSESIAALFQRLTQGVYVVGVAYGEVRNAFTAAWVMQVSYDPLLLALSINPNHSSYLLLKEGRSFSVNVPKKGQLDLADHFGRSDRADKLALTEWTTDRIGVPLLREVLAWFECQVVSEQTLADRIRATCTNRPQSSSASDQNEQLCDYQGTPTPNIN
jgi:flavin reductase (DIM6/NTAB) family NADH-FMN oxidoreductase RutF